MCSSAGPGDLWDFDERAFVMMEDSGKDGQVVEERWESAGVGSCVYSGWMVSLLVV